VRKEGHTVCPGGSQTTVNAADLNSIPIVDSLVHLTPDGEWYETGLDASLERLAERCDRYYSKVLLVGMPGMDGANDYVMKLAKQQPARFVPVAGLTISPGDTPATVEERIAGLAAQGFKGIKLHPRQLQLPLDHPHISAAIGLAGKYRMLSLVCTVYRHPLPPLGRPIYDVLYKLCFENTDSRIVLLHGGYFELLAVSEIVRPLENVLLDLSTTLVRFKNTHLISDIRHLFTTFDRRLCIGSDFPEYTIDDVLDSIREKDLARGLTREKVTNIFSGNLERFMNWE